MTSTRKSPRQRVDSALVAQGLAVSREQAHRLVLAGLVKVNGALVDKRAKLVEADDVLEVTASPMPFVSRGGGKLDAALEAFDLDCRGLITLDVGASTGGFTDCLLKRGAARVYAVDVGYGQLDWKLRNHPRVVVLERCNIRYLEKARIPDPIDLAVIDVSFISLKLVLPRVLSFLKDVAVIIALVKPQFEVGMGQVGRGGVVRDEIKRRQVTEDILAYADSLGLRRIGVIDSPVVGRKGNREVLIGLRRVQGN